MLPSTQAAPIWQLNALPFATPAGKLPKSRQHAGEKKSEKKKSPLGSISVMFKAFLGRIMYSFFLVLSW